MINFDRNGNPQPLGVTELHVADFKLVFVDNFDKSETRSKIFESYSTYIGDFQKEIVHNFINWVNGSYTTTKENPNDIDIVNLIEHDDNLNSKSHLLEKFLTKGGSKDTYLVDGYFVPVYPDNDPRFQITEHWRNYWLNWFGKDRQGKQKGIIQLSFS